MTSNADYGAALADERDFADRLAAELARHGWGDFHYGEQPQDPAIVALLDEHKRRRQVSLTKGSAS